MEINQ